MASSTEFSKKSKHSVMTDTDSSDASGERGSWIDSYLEQSFGDWFCNIPLSFAGDGFNTFGIAIDQARAKSAFHHLLGSDSDSSDSFDSDSEEEIERCTEKIFGLIHSRYIFTADGLNEMKKKYQDGVFGYCPRFYCNKQNLLPLGLTDHPGVATVKLYCPNCKQIYEADDVHSKIDGAFFTKSFAHYFLLEMNQMKNGRAQIDLNNITSEFQSPCPVFI
ncbi:Casein kinase II regulatory subunit family protein [Histomonas meleagridis]|uniref:Casein kinase II regulatory subunit family protein n=1 Tax=Histomonas meleagridis TaxID=135588 RepID=UPI0035598CA7|nr:Casein kinase II regulatory subunit family protein [Histomonas meleagridis]KAH0796768.1 Casein kinase II regulatory subunit family protein [Histomonas meleagridis]